MLRFLIDFLTHKVNVLEHAWKLGIFWRGLLHDLSKLRPSELRGLLDIYRDGPTKRTDLAYLLHQHRNPHHWGYWALLTEGLPEGNVGAYEMPLKYRKEMMCDWMAKCGSVDLAAAWYVHNHQSILLHPNTRAWVELFLYAQGQRN